MTRDASAGWAFPSDPTAVAKAAMRQEAPERSVKRDRRDLVVEAQVPDWRSLLIVDGKRMPRPLLANAITALRNAPEWQGLLWFDAFAQRTMLRGAAPWMTDRSGREQEWSNALDIRAADWLQHAGILVSPEVAGQAVEIIADEHRFHPVLEYLARCQWDGESRLDRWACEFLGAPSTEYVSAAGARWMIAAVARVYEPGCKADHAIILEGRQGLLKSTALKTLAAPWFADEIADLGTKDSALQVAGAWVLEFAELDSISRGEVGRIKAFMSRSVDRFRPPYGRRVVEVPRQCVFAGTVNASEYLRDETGGRRFWPLECTKVDIDGLAAARDQLWGEARVRYLAGEAWWLDSEILSTAAAEVQRGRYQADAWEGPIREFVAARRDVIVGDVLKDALHISVDKWGQGDANRVARCLKALGWERFQCRYDGKREWRYRPSPLSPVSGDDQ
jgi:predicted P-loop ATPase